MPGVRIQHPTARSVTFTLVDGSRPYHEPWACPPPPAGCASTHLMKTYHIPLDETGAAIVSLEIIERLGRIPGQPFALTNEVVAPPAQRLLIPSPLKVLARALAPGNTEVSNG